MREVKREEAEEVKEPEWRRESDRRRRRRRRLTVFRLRSVAPAYFVIVIIIGGCSCIVPPTAGDVTDSSTYYSKSHIGIATMSVRMENVAARKINYKMMVSTPIVCDIHTHTYTHAHIHIHTFLLFISFSLSLYSPLSRSSRPIDGDGGCAVRVQLAAYFAQLRRARERVLTWRATTSSRVAVFTLCIPRLFHLPSLFSSLSRRIPRFTGIARLSR